jgi:ABC-type multidrug transport system fused ATPase/permease subunit
VTAHTRSDELVPEDETPGGAGALGPLDPKEPAPGEEEGAAEDDSALSISLGFRLIRRFVRRHPLPFALSILGGVGWAVMLVTASEVLGWVTDHVIEPAFSTGVDAREVWIGVVALASVGVLRGLTVVVRRWFGSLTEARMQRSLRSEVADKLLVMRMGSYRARSTGTLLATSDVDVTTACQMLMPLPFSLGVVALVLVSMVSLWRSDPAFAVVALLLFPTLAWLSRYYTNKVHEPSARVQQRLGEVSAIAHESFDGVMVVKTLAREDAERERFAGASARLAEERIGLARMTAVFEPMITMLPNLGMVALLVTGAVRIETGDASIGDLVQAVALFGWLAFPMRVVGFLFQSMPRAVVSIARIDDLLAEPDDPQFEGAPADPIEGSPSAKGPPTTGRSASLPEGPLSLELVDVGFTFGGEPALSGVGFRAEAGEVLALVGSTGSGKSTLVGLLAHLDKPDEGEVLVGGVPSGDVDPVELHRALSVAFQESYLFAESVAANVDLGRGIEPEAIRSSLRRTMADGFVDALPAGADTIVGERGVTLSGGQRQRVALARALAAGPRIVVLDDATSAVDPIVESRILQRLREGDTTMLLVAHRLSTIVLADRVVHLDGGAVKGVGTHHELLADPDYAALVTAYEEEDLRAQARRSEPAERSEPEQELDQHGEQERELDQHGEQERESDRESEL